MKTQRVTTAVFTLFVFLLHGVNTVGAQSLTPSPSLTLTPTATQSPPTNPTGICQGDPSTSGCIDIGGIQIPNFSILLGSLIQLFFVLSGVAALIYLVWGAFAWVTSGGEKGKVEEAQKKIIAAVVGLIVLVAVLSLAVFLEQVVFGGNFCFGISCPINTAELQLLPTAPTVTPVP